MKNPIYELSAWQKSNPELQRLLATLFGTKPDASEPELLEAARAFTKKIAPFIQNNPDERAALEALQADIERLAVSMLSPTDRAVCKQLGLTALDFLKK
jgi:hypothetical protein